MSSINTGKVVAGGLVAGVVLNALDFANNALLVGADFTANATRLGLDPALMESTRTIATWVVADFVLGLLLVWTYAAIRPRFGAGPKTAVFAAVVPWLSIVAVITGLTVSGMFPMALHVKMTVVTFFIMSIGSVAGAWVYKEA